MPFRINLKKPLRDINQKMSIQAIANEVGVTKNTVMKYMNSEIESLYLHDSAAKLAIYCGINPNKLEGWATYYDEDAESPETQNVTPGKAA